MPESRAGRVRLSPIRRWERVLVVLGIALAALAGSFALWDPLDIDERAHVRRITKHSAEGVRADLEAEMGSLLLAQRLVARVWGGRAALTRADWEREAGLFLDHNPSFVLVEWNDPGRGVRWSRARRGGSPAPVLAAVASHNARMRGPPSKVVDAAFSPFFLLPDGSPGSRVVVPVAANEAGDGGGDRVLASIVDLQAAFDEMLSDHRELGYSMSVREDDTVFYRTPGARIEDEDRGGRRPSHG